MSEPANETAGMNDFEMWLNDRNGWLQTAARQLIDNKRLPNGASLQSWFDFANWRPSSRVTLDF